MRAMSSGTCSEGVESASTRRTPFRTVAVCESCAEVGTIPGQSMRYMRRVNVMYCQTYVSEFVKTHIIGLYDYEPLFPRELAPRDTPCRSSGC